jgi:hypothetical protein
MNQIFNNGDNLEFYNAIIDKKAILVLCDAFGLLILGPVHFYPKLYP